MLDQFTDDLNLKTPRARQVLRQIEEQAIETIATTPPRHRRTGMPKGDRLLATYSVSLAISLEKAAPPGSAQH